MSSASQLDPRKKGSEILLLGVWFGLVTGLIEGAGLLGFQQLNLLSFEMAEMGVSAPIVWVSTAFDLALFFLLGLLLAAAQRLLPRLPWLRLSVLLFSWLAFFDWLALTGRLRHFGVLFLAVGLAVAFARWFKNHEATALQFWRRSLLGVAALALLALVGVQGGLWLKERMALARLPAARPGTPNILVIVVDTLRADHLSSYGYSQLTSPNIDRTARQGVLFENAFSTSSWTLPSHASLLTGRYPHEHGAEKASYDGRYPTLAGALRERGYRTAAFSANTIWFDRRRGFDAGFVHFEDYFGSVADMIARTVYGRKLEQFVLQPLGNGDPLGRKQASKVNEEVLRWVGSNPRIPFVAFLNYYDVHDPYLPPEPYRHQFSSQKDPGGIINSSAGRDHPTLTAKQLQGEIDAYDGAIAYVDYQIGQLLAEFDRRGLGENTLLIITSDHGESFGEHGLVIHRTALYRELIQVPLIFYWPGHLPAGLRLTQPVSNVSFPATLMELLGAPTQTTFPGPSLVQLWVSPGPRPDWPYPRSELAQMPFRLMSWTPAFYGRMTSLVSPQWHYILHEKFGPSLYAWQQDPAELHDLAHTPEGQSIAREFASHLQDVFVRSSGAKLAEADGVQP